MGIVYSGLTIVNTTLDGSSPAALKAGLQGALVSCGWSVVHDGTSSGIWCMGCITTPQGLTGNVWFQDSAGAGTTLLINAAGTPAGAYNTALQTELGRAMQTGAGYVYQFIGTGYYFYLFRSSVPCPAGQSYMWHCPMIPTFLSGTITSCVLAMFGASDPAELTKAICTFNANCYGWSFLNGVGGGAPFIPYKWCAYGTTSSAKPTWFDLSCEFYEARVNSYGYNPSSGGLISPPYCVGYLWDALIANYPLPRNTNITYDSNSWTVLTESTDPAFMYLSA